MAFKKIIFITSVSLFLASCTFVRLTPAGENVAIMTDREVANCTRTGTTTVEVLDRAIIERNPDKVARDLRIMARNRAADRGDTIVPSSLVDDGEQTFVIYRCRN